MNEVFIVAIIFGSIVWVIDRIVDRISLNRERVKLLDKDGDLSILNTAKSEKNWLAGNDLRYGLVLIGAGLGSFLGAFFNNSYFFGDSNISLGYFFGVTLCVGIALIISHFVNQSKG